MLDALQNGMPIVAGVIPKDIGTDHVLQRFLWNQHCNVEVALHGYDHAGGSDYDEAIGEFGEIDAVSAEQKIRTGVAEIHRAVGTPIPITTFIPPQNNISPAGAAVLEQMNFDVLSKSGIGPYDYDAKTWNYEEDTLIRAVSIMEKCDETFAKGDPLCVIMLHPQDFAAPDGTLDAELYREYQTLLTLLSLTNTSVVRFSDVTKTNLLFDKVGE
jgi:peptidoglycan/xylan/chitin deacetylase (PgdA/CDA1 family)